MKWIDFTICWGAVGVMLLGLALAVGREGRVEGREGRVEGLEARERVEYAARKGLELRVRELEVVVREVAKINERLQREVYRLRENEETRETPDGH